METISKGQSMNNDGSGINPDLLIRLFGGNMIRSDVYILANAFGLKITPNQNVEIDIAKFLEEAKDDI